jgi:hypothetical protein
MKNLLILISLIFTIFVYAQVTNKNPDCEPMTNAEKMYESILIHANGNGLSWTKP